MAINPAKLLRNAIARIKEKLPAKGNKVIVPQAESSEEELARGVEEPEKKIIKPEGGVRPRVVGGAPKITLSGPLLLALSLVLVCAVAWAFFMGLMVGRGQNPQDTIPGMATASEPEAAGTDSPFAESPEVQGPAGMLPVPTPVPTSSNAGVHNPPTGAAANAWPQETPVKPKPTQAKPAPPTNSNQQYNYVFQAAAFRNNKDATKAQDGLKGKGIRATVRRSGKVYLLMVDFQGTQAQADKMLVTMRRQGIGKPMQVSRTPVQAKSARGQRKKGN